MGEARGMGQTRGMGQARGMEKAVRVDLVGWWNGGMYD